MIFFKALFTYDTLYMLNLKDSQALYAYIYIYIYIYIYTLGKPYKTENIPSPDCRLNKTKHTINVKRI